VTLLSIPVTPLKLEYFFSGSVDLREIYENPESEELFYAEVVGEIRDIQLIPLVRESWLPAHDLG
jgi:hypothetical protein